ncbi:UNVERIFIED_CONTAM: hypothetical protein NCL1_31977 [Trichonephila clavipes]
MTDSTKYLNFIELEVSKIEGILMYIKKYEIFYQTLVAWIRVESQTILSIHTHIITRNYRITLDHKNRQNWNLAIASVEESDRGQYMCQINTVPMKKRITYLEILLLVRIVPEKSKRLQ